MGRRLKYDMPGPDWRRSLEEIQEKGWRELFEALPGESPTLVVEMGFGRGEFLLGQATRRQECAFIGIDYSRKRVLKFARRLARTEVFNIRLVEVTAENFVRTGLGDGCVDEFWINFPDPWPKARHARRRLLKSSFVVQLRRLLRPGGVVFAATDSPEYAAEIDLVLGEERGLENRYSSGWAHDVPGRMQTAYEKTWRAEGRTMYFFAYRRPEESE